MNEFVDTRINNCRFGYGGIHLSSCMQILMFREIKPPIGAGNKLFDKENNIKIGDWEYTGNRLSIDFENIYEIESFYASLKKIEEDKGGVFKFKDITLDFTEYKQESLDVVKSVMRGIESNVMRLLAC